MTGASSGIGLATCLRASRQGAHVVLVARGATALEEAARRCEEAGAASTLVLSADVGDDDAVSGVVAAVLERHGRLDAVVSNAGVVAYGRTEDVPAEVFDRVLRTNLTGSVNVARHVVPVLRRQGEGALLFVGSVIGHISVPTMSAYVLSKWGVRALARQLQLENRDLDGVHVGYVAPGGVDTPIYEQAANYEGVVGRPPPPVSSPDRVARQILHHLDHDRARDQLTLANDVIRFGYTVLPFAYDRLVATLFRLGAVDLTRETPPTTGNVLEPHEEGNALTGDAGGALAGIARNIRKALRS
ncbi:SDR family NAD(P)-dependent oxidoreductase [Nocardioides lijunqiniae]|uniref:SDR family NAD(P)-dependent oxidoreductase n=1 Tax=Nocardioides lijunqiniae TaxID=2760832 RepID=UPI0030B85C32